MSASASSLTRAISASFFAVGFHSQAGLPASLDQFVDRLDRGLHLLVAVDDRAEHHVLGQLVRFRLDHQHGGVGAGDHQVELRLASIWVAVGFSTYWPSM